MTTHRTHIALPGSAKAEGALQACCRCKHDKPPEGGVNVTPTKWYCFSCWRVIQQLGRSRRCTA